MTQNEFFTTRARVRKAFGIAKMLLAAELPATDSNIDSVSLRPASVQTKVMVRTLIAELA